MPLAFSLTNSNETPQNLKFHAMLEFLFVSMSMN